MVQPHPLEKNTHNTTDTKYKMMPLPLRRADPAAASNTANDRSSLQRLGDAVLPPGRDGPPSAEAVPGAEAAAAGRGLWGRRRKG